LHPIDAAIGLYGAGGRLDDPESALLFERWWTSGPALVEFKDVVFFGRLDLIG
jgi:hypothetical protein